MSVNPEQADEILHGISASRRFVSRASGGKTDAFKAYRLDRNVAWNARSHVWVLCCGSRMLDWILTWRRPGCEERQALHRSYPRFSHCLLVRESLHRYSCYAVLLMLGCRTDIRVQDVAFAQRSAHSVRPPWSGLHSTTWNPKLLFTLANLLCLGAISSTNIPFPPRSHGPIGTSNLIFLLSLASCLKTPVHDAAHVTTVHVHM